MLTPENVKSYIERLKKEKGGTEQESCRKVIQDFLNLTRKIDVRISDGMRHETLRNDGTILRDVGYRIVVSRREAEEEISFALYNLQFLSPDSCSESGLDPELPRPNLSDILQHIGFSAAVMAPWSLMIQQAEGIIQMWSRP